MWAACEIGQHRIKSVVMQYEVMVPQVLPSLEKKIGLCSDLKMFHGVHKLFLSFDIDHPSVQMKMCAH